MALENVAGLRKGTTMDRRTRNALWVWAFVGLYAISAVILIMSFRGGTMPERPPAPEQRTK